VPAELGDDSVLYGALELAKSMAILPTIFIAFEEINASSLFSSGPRVVDHRREGDQP